MHDGGGNVRGADACFDLCGCAELLSYLQRNGDAYRHSQGSEYQHNGNARFERGDGYGSREFLLSWKLKGGMKKLFGIALLLFGGWLLLHFVTAKKA